MKWKETTNGDRWNNQPRWRARGAGYTIDVDPRLKVSTRDIVGYYFFASCSKQGVSNYNSIHSGAVFKTPEEAMTAAEEWVREVKQLRV